MPIVQAGSINPVAVLVPNIYIGIVQPPLVLQGAPTNTLGVVGSSPWGPVGQGIAVGDPSSYTAAFGPVTARTYDAGTQVATAALQGANSFVIVRVTDGTDDAATAAIGATEIAKAPSFYSSLANAVNAGIPGQRGPSALATFNVAGTGSAAVGTIAAVYTGTVGNGVVFSVAPGSKVGTWRAVISRPGYPSELFDNIAASVGSAPTMAAYALAGGTDGAAGITDAMLVGSSVTPLTGMYVLQKQAVAAAVLADHTDHTAWSVIAAFGDAQGIVFYASGPAGETITAAAANKAASGADDYGIVTMLGDWIYWSDQVNGLTRMVSPTGFAAGKRVALAPNDSILNKPLVGVVSSEKFGQPGSGTSATYTDAELQALVLAGLEVITNPAPGGNYWAARIGHNASSNASVQSDSYTVMTNFIAKTINGGMGRYVGKPISTQLCLQARSTLLALFSSMQTAGLIGGPGTTVAYSVVCDASNNPGIRTGIGYMQADCSVQYQGINEKFFVNLEGGATVTIGATA
jgi:hypothetical protein